LRCTIKPFFFTKILNKDNIIGAWGKISDIFTGAWGKISKISNIDLELLSYLYENITQF
jgi:hypothetical protein